MDDTVPDDAACDIYYIDMYDSYGDGWHGNELTIDGESFTIEWGSSGYSSICLEPGCYYVTLDGGSW